MGKVPANDAGLIHSLSRVFHYTWPGLRKHRLGLLGGGAAMIGGVLFQLLEPWPLKLVIDRIFAIESARPVSTIPFFDTLPPTTLIGVCAAMVLVIALMRATAEYWSKVSFAVIGNKVLTKVRNNLYAHLLRLPLSFHESARAGDLVVRLTGDMNRLRDAAVTAVLPLLANALVLVGMLTVMFVMNWKLALIGLVAFPLFLLSAMRVTQRIRDVARKQRKREGAMAATASESFGAIRTLQSFNLADYFSQLFNSQSKKSFREGARGTRLSTMLERKVDIFIAVALSLVLLMGAGYVLENKMSPGDLLVFLTYMKRTLRPVKDFAKYTGRLAKAAAAGERVLDLLEEVPDIVDAKDAFDAPPFRGAITFQQISFAYDPRHRVLNRLDLEIPAGSRIAIVGASGIGKSTLINLLLRFYDPSEGTVTIDGTDIRRFTLESLRRQVALVSQDNLLFAQTIGENIRLGRPDATDEEVESVARLANADAFIRRLPDGYETNVAERGVTLSHGQRQRIAIARAALVGAPILLLDEPTTGLDEDNRKAIITSLDGLHHGSTVILVTHDLLHASRSEWIVHLGHDGVMEQGSHPELMALGGPYARLYGLQATAHEDDTTPTEDPTYAVG